MARRKPRSPGVILRGRSAGFHRYDDEIACEGGKAVMHRRVRRVEKDALRREITTLFRETATL